jgi:phage protein U
VEWGSFGNISFKLGTTPKVIRRTNRYRYIKHDVVNRYPHFGSMGEDVEEMELTVELSYIFTNVAKTIDAFKELAQKGKPQRLVIGKLNTGKWVITEIQRAYQETDREGNLLKANLTLKLIKIRL